MSSGLSVPGEAALSSVHLGGTGLEGVKATCYGSGEKNRNSVDEGQNVPC